MAICHWNACRLLQTDCCDSRTAVVQNDRELCGFFPRYFLDDRPACVGRAACVKRFLYCAVSEGSDLSGRPDSIITDFLPDDTRMAFEALPHWTTVSRTYGLGQAGLLCQKAVPSACVRHPGPMQSYLWQTLGGMRTCQMTHTHISCLRVCACAFVRASVPCLARSTVPRKHTFFASIGLWA